MIQKSQERNGVCEPCALLSGPCTFTPMVVLASNPSLRSDAATPLRQDSVFQILALQLKGVKKTIPRILLKHLTSHCRRLDKTCSIRRLQDLSQVGSRFIVAESLRAKNLWSSEEASHGIAIVVRYQEWHPLLEIFRLGAGEIN